MQETGKFEILDDKQGKLKDLIDNLEGQIDKAQKSIKETKEEAKSKIDTSVHSNDITDFKKQLHLLRSENKFLNEEIHSIKEQVANEKINQTFIRPKKPIKKKTKPKQTDEDRDKTIQMLKLEAVYCDNIECLTTK